MRRNREIDQATTRAKKHAPKRTQPMRPLDPEEGSKLGCDTGVFSSLAGWMVLRAETIGMNIKLLRLYS